MEVDSSNEGSVNRAILMDITVFLNTLNTTSHNLTYKDFRAKWEEMDLDLLTHFAPPETILGCLVHLGLFGPTRPFRDHKTLVFFLFSVYRGAGKALKVSVDRVQFLLGVKGRAEMMLREEAAAGEVVEALEALFSRDAFVIVAEDPFKSANWQPAAPLSICSIDQILDRIKRIELFLSAHPLFDQKFHRASIPRLRSLFDRYSEAKRRAGLFHYSDSVSVSDSNSEFDLGGVLRILEGYEKLVNRSSVISPSHPVSKSIRSRLSQNNALTPLATTTSSSSSLPSDLFPTVSTATGNTSAASTSVRPQSVPTTRMRRTSCLRDVDLDEFMETSTSSTNMPDINFY